jgi:hypothetical protein
MEYHRGNSSPCTVTLNSRKNNKARTAHTIPAITIPCDENKVANKEDFSCEVLPIGLKYLAI